MPAQVLFHERLDEVVAVVVLCVTPQLQLLPGPLAGVLEQLGPQLLGQEFIAEALVDQDRVDARRLLHQVRRVIGQPVAAIRADLLRRLDRADDAAQAYDRAIARADNVREREFLPRQRQTLAGT